MSIPTTIFLADLAHTFLVSDEALTIPLGIGYTRAYTAAHRRYTVNVQLHKKPEVILAAAATPPEIIDFANYEWNENLNRAIGRHRRRGLPDALFVADGPNIDPEIDRRFAFLNKHDYTDFLIVDGDQNRSGDTTGTCSNGRVP